jgi:acyl-CoA thioester hydrolase
MGYVYHGNYAQYIELGRLSWLKSLGLSYKEMEKNGIMLPVYSLNIRYIKPAFYDDILTIETNLKELPSVRITFEYKIFNSLNELLTTAVTTLIFVNTSTGKPMRCPQEIVEKVLKASAL